MWRELVERLGEGCKFSPPSNRDAISQAEHRLSIKFPDDLREFLVEGDGVVCPLGTAMIWPADRIVADNIEFRTFPNFRELYMPFDHLLFCGDDGSGDQFAFRILAGAVDDANIYRWGHEDDSREWFAGGMKDYLARRLGHDSIYNALQ